MLKRMDTVQKSPTHDNSSSSKMAPLPFPLRELAVGAFEAYKMSPLGLKPSGKFWREIGVASATSLKDTSLEDAVGRGLLLEPSSAWGISIGYLPGPEGFRIPGIRGGLTGLPDSPSADEIRNHAKVRILTAIVEALSARRCRSAPETRVRQAFNLQVGDGGEIVEALALAGLIEKVGSELVPTPAMLIRIGREHSAHVLSASLAEVAPPPRSHHVRRAQREALYQEVSPRLKELLQQRPGLTPTEIFHELEKLPVWPPQASKEVCIAFLDRAVREQHIQMRRNERGRGALYFWAS